MTYAPQPNETIHIGKTNNNIADHPTASGIPFDQEGRQANVYQLISDNEKKALKVQKHRFRDPSLVCLGDRIKGYASMQVCRRIVLSPRHHRELLQFNPDLIHSVLMPYVEITTWTEYASNSEQLPL